MGRGVGFALFLYPSFESRKNAMIHFHLVNRFSYVNNQTNVVIPSTVKTIF